jgi:hypothetical protein
LCAVCGALVGEGHQGPTAVVSNIGLAGTFALGEGLCEALMAQVDNYSHRSSRPSVGPAFYAIVEEAPVSGGVLARPLSCRARA